MQNKRVTLPQDVWDRLIEILDAQRHPDTAFILLSITNQLSFDPADVAPLMTSQNTLTDGISSHAV